VITYEYPLNERIRTLLRLEDLFERSRHFIGLSDPLDHHMALLTLFEILEVASRADLKSDLLQELERQKQVLISFRNNPDIAEEALSGVLKDIEQAAAALFSMTGKIGQYLRENDWLMSIKQRTGIPGGACEFDLPSYHYWLHRPAENRPARGLDRTALPAARRLGHHSAHPARIGPAAGGERAAGHVPANARRQDGANAAPAPRSGGALRAGDQRQQIRAQHPLHRPERRGSAPAHRRLGRALRADLLQPVKKVPCPRCGAPALFAPENPWRPFCSERCRMIDLGKWASESYRVPVEEKEKPKE